MPDSVINDLELIHLTGENSAAATADAETDTTETADPERKPIYHYLLEPKNEYANLLLKDWSKYFTDDVEFLKQTQEIIKTKQLRPDSGAAAAPLDESFLHVWKEVKQDRDFLEKYGYMDWKCLEFLNHSELFLDIMSIYSICSPVISLLLPIFLLIIPFFIIKLQGIPITFSIYISTLQSIARHNIIGKTLSQIAWNMSFEKIMYLMVSILLYVLQTYQNTICCIRHYNNLKRIHEHLKTTREFVSHSIDQIEYYVAQFGDGGVSKCVAYSQFCKEAREHAEVLRDFKIQLDELTNISPFGKIGRMMKYYYLLHKDKQYEKSIQYAIGFEGYILHLESIQQNLEHGYIAMCDYVRTGATARSEGGKKKRRKAAAKPPPTAKTVFHEQYYPPLKYETPVKNDVNLEKNILITGPNASGKTTLLKTTILNIIFSQQFGCGFYSKCNINPYTYVHSYLNIPDTSGRDSLFQAEAKRCKDILNIIQTAAPDSRHFCIFDELYSGTNPSEAIQTAQAFLSYLSEYTNVRYMLTTHYNKVCKILQKKEAAECYRMKTIEEEGELIYTYHVEKGISTILGAMKVLKSMDYPEEILYGATSGEESDGDSDGESEEEDEDEDADAAAEPAF